MAMHTNPVHLCSYLTQHISPPNTAPALFAVYQGQETTAYEARTRVLHLSSILSHQLNLLPGDRVATLALSTPNHLETLLAIIAAGGIAAPLNWRWSVSEAQYAVNHIQATVICADEACLPLARQVAELCPLIKVLVVLGGSGSGGDSSLESTIKEINGNKRQYRVLNAEDIINHSQNSSNNSTNTLLTAPDLKQPDDGAAFLIFTSGTTGPPRAAVLSHAALHFQCNAKLRCCGYNKSDIYLHTAQLFHVGGLCSALAMLLAGAQHVFLRLFRAIECLKAIEMYNVTSLIAVPTMISDLLQAAAAQEGGGGKKIKIKTFPCVQSVLVGAGGLSPSVVTRLHELIPNATIYSAYGMTEACSSLTFSTLLASSLATAKTTAAEVEIGAGVYVGCPPPGIELAVLPLSLSSSPSMYNKKFEKNASQILQQEGYGEIVTRGPHTMLRYWNDPEATYSTFLHPPPPQNSNNFTNNWMKTGDIGLLKSTTTPPSAFIQSNQQCLWLVGRAKDFIKSGGENVSAAEVERALLSHPAVAVAAVVGLPDERLGERVAAVVVLNSGYTWQEPAVVVQLVEDERLQSTSSSTNQNSTVHALQLQEHCRGVAGVAGFKLPRAFFLFNSDGEIPRNATGKVVKSQLKETCIQKLKEATPRTFPLRSRL